MNKPIVYYSTNLNAKPVTFRDALLKGMAPDRGLYMPQEIPELSSEELRSLAGKDYYEIAYAIGKKFLSSNIPDEDLLAIVKDAYKFPVPLENVYDGKYVLRLDQGPTASFKDFAAQMMGRLMQYFLKQENRNLLILTATSGDTGSAIANAFYGLDNIKVVVLYPEKEVTDRQRKQMTTLGKNIQIISLDGKFDDCQAMVKRAFADPELEYLQLSSANSINIGRLLPQMMYYFYSFAHVPQTSLRQAQDRLSFASQNVPQASSLVDGQVIFSVPSGNFGNLMGGLIAKKMGLPVKKFVVAVNENDEFPKFAALGTYEKIVPSKNCISCAMNVGHPSNLARLVALYGGQMDEKGTVSKSPDFELIRNHMYAISISDEETKATIKQAYQDRQLLLEPHGAVAWAGLSHYLEDHREDEEHVCISLETAHPAKFPGEIQEILALDPELPPSLKGLEEKEEFLEKISNDYEEFKNFLKENY